MTYIGKPGPKPRPAPTIRAEMPKLPRGVLGEDARRIWNELGPQLVELGWMTALDGPAFMMLCVHASIALEAARELRGNGVIAEDERGLARKHPASQILRDHSAAFRQFAAEFGLTPSSRVGREVGKTQETLSDEITRIVAEMKDGR